MEKVNIRKNIVYQIYPRSFLDTNGDGIGDIRGIIDRLNYVKELGANVIWLSPVYKSPLVDMGYDISDYMDIHPDYGTMEDMDELISKAKELGIRIIMDLVINHTSDKHKWFQEALKDKNSPYRDYYYFRKGKGNNLPPNNWDSMFSGSAWSEVPGEKGTYFLHLFAKEQVDLNFHNEAVIQEVEKIMKFWLDKGVYGFRCDVINLIWKTSLDDGKGKFYLVGHEHYLNQDGMHKLLKRFNEEVFSHYDCMNVGEGLSLNYENAKKFLDNELSMMFSFDHMNCDKMALPIFPKKYKPKNLKRILVGWQENCQWNANYFENHDQRRSISRFGNEHRYHNESGKMLATILFTLRGTPYVYQGEEIGMLNSKFASVLDSQDVSARNVYNTMIKAMHLPKKTAEKLADIQNRDHARTPMQWTANVNGGFTSGNKTWLPVNENHRDINAALNSLDTNSILHYYSKLAKLRNDTKALYNGGFHYIKKTHKDVFAYYRIDGSERVLVVVNMRGKNRPFRKLDIKGEVLLSNYETPHNNKYLRPYESLIILKR